MTSDDVLHGEGGDVSERLREDYGDEAARFLHRDRPTIEARVRGIRSLEIVDELLAAERATRDRDDVVALLAHWRDVLDRNPPLRRPLEERPWSLRWREPKAVVFLDADGEPRQRDRSAADKLARLRTARRRPD